MILEIDVLDYLAEDEIKTVCKDAVAYQIAQILDSEESITRMISNCAYMLVWQMVDDALAGGLNDLIRTKVIDVINGLSSYSVFRNKDLLCNQDSVGQKILDEEVSAARPLIKARVESIIANYPFHELDHGEIGDVVYECIMNKLFRKNDD